MELELIKAQALKEIEQEDFKIAVDKYKKKLREKRSLWDLLFPWKIVILKKENLKWT